MLYKPRRHSGGMRHRLLDVTGYNNRTASKNSTLMLALMGISSAVCLDGCSHSSHLRPKVLGYTPHSQVSQHSRGSWQTVAHIVEADWGEGGESAHRAVEPHWHLVEVWKLTVRFSKAVWMPNFSMKHWCIQTQEMLRETRRLIFGATSQRTPSFSV